jgi:hypothetical protein
MAGSQIKSWGMRLMRTKGWRRAVVAVARKLTVLMHRMWIDGTEFRQEPVGERHDLKRHPPDPNGVVLTGRGLCLLVHVNTPCLVIDEAENVCCAS